METVYQGTDDSKVCLGDCLDVMRQLPDNSVDAIVSDPPYGIKFMGKQWDHGVPGEAFWREALRVAKPGAHLFAFGGDRTYHRLACAVEDVGWDLRRMFMWVYGSGFPKSLDISKAMDKAAGVTFEEHPALGCGFMTPNGKNGYHTTIHRLVRTGESSDLAKQWTGWGTDVKPALEPIALARKPFKGTVCDNVLQWGTGGLNIDGCRVPAGSEYLESVVTREVSSSKTSWDTRKEPQRNSNNRLGRFPANLIHDGSEEAIAGFPITGKPTRISSDDTSVADATGGSASRYFYCAKASPSERGDINNHPTVKPLALMRYLCRLITPPNGIILDPFAGSGSTLIAARQEGFRFIGIEKSPEYTQIILKRLESLETPDTLPR